MGADTTTAKNASMLEFRETLARLDDTARTFVEESMIDAIRTERVVLPSDVLVLRVTLPDERMVEVYGHSGFYAKLVAMTARSGERSLR